MTWPRLVGAELRKLASTRMPWAFLGVLVAISAINAAVVIFGTDMDGSKGFIATADDQRSLMAFAANAMLGASLFGAIASAREYGHGTVIPTFLAEPHRDRAVLAQLAAVAVGGGALSLVGAGLTVGAVAAALPMTDYSFLVSAQGVASVLAASTFAGAAGAVLGAGIGMLVRNTGGAVTAVVLVLFILPPLAVQLISEAVSWIPNTLAGVLSGVGDEVGVMAALGAIVLWALIPAAIGLVAVQRRDVV
jgi:hypothetical protein